MARSNSFSRKLLVPLAISAVTLLLLEIVSWIVFPRLTGRQLDFVELALQRSEQIQTLEEQRDRQKGLYSLHPYVGYSGRPGAPIGAEGGPVFNSYGMWTQPGRPFPYKRKRDEFVIAVLGGSVAERFVVIGGEGILQDHLARANDLFRRKKVVLISLATGGYNGDSYSSFVGTVDHGHSIIQPMRVHSRASEAGVREDRLHLWRRVRPKNGNLAVVTGEVVSR